MDTASPPLISCVMPTTARRRQFIPQAIRYFQRQDYANKELLIVDDGPESVADIVPDGAQVRYVRLAGERSLGAKRNLCVEAARGDLIMHWDDDDWASPRRISLQTEALLNHGAEICGVRQMLFYELATARTWLYEYPTGHRPWLAGNSLLYTRDFWRRSPFPDVQVASDTRFVWSQDLERSISIPDYSFYVAMIHPDNTSPKNYQGSYWSPWYGSIRDLMGAQDSAFYRKFLANEEDHQEPPADELVHQETPPPPPATKAMLAMPAAPFAEARDESERASHHHPAKLLPGLMPEHVSPLIHTNGRKPRLSCILATGNRPAFTRQAIRCFLRQTFDDSELIVVDDGDESIASLCAGLFRVSYVRLDERTVLGRKLNIGIEHSRGDIIQKLDDDDFYRQDFLARSVGALLDAGDARAVVSWDCFTVFITGDPRLRYSGHGWTTGGTLCFNRRLWEKHPFRDEPRDVDTWFIKDHDPRLVKVCAPDLYMLVRHGRNTWGQLSNGFSVNDYFKSLPPQGKCVEEAVEPLDRCFYQQLANGGAQ